MSKEVRNIVIAIVLSLVVGYAAGSASQTGRCPFTGTLMCKDRAAACDKAKACAAQCESKEACETAPEAAKDAK